MRPAEPVSYERVSELFAQLCDLDPETRSEWLDRECPGQPALRGAVERLLSLDDKPPHTLVNPNLRGSTPDSIPEQINHYQIERVLGKGGMGIVLQGRDDRLRRPVAMKLLRRGPGGSNALHERFEQEARIGGSLEHPGIVPVYELGESEDGTRFFTMRRIDGSSLAELLRNRGEDVGRDRRRFFSIYEQTVHAVAYAHSRGVIHRDLKPSNVMIGSFGEVLVVDWGLARRLDEADERGRVVLGTPAYMPPEQASSGNVDQRADVFALGAVLCEILTGAPPYAGESEHTLALAERGDTSSALARLEACEADPDVISLARRCIATDPNERPQDAGEVASSFVTYLASIEERVQQARIETARSRERAHAATRARHLTQALAAAIVIGSVGWAWMQLDRAQRRHRTDQLVSEALKDAELLSDRAREADDGGSSHWAGAIAAARRAKSFLASTNLDPAREKEVSTLIAALVTEEGAARIRRAGHAADQQLLRRLETVPISPDDLLDAAGYEVEHEARRAHEYELAFRSSSLRVLQGTEEDVAEQVKRRVAIGEIASAIDHWAMALRTIDPEDPAWRRLIRISRQADPKAFRQRLRDIILRGTTNEEVAELAANADIGALLPQSILLLGRLTEQHADHGTSIALFRRARGRHHDDFAIAFRLAEKLAQLDDPPWEEIRRCLEAAVALRPQSLQARYHLGESSRELKDYGSARRVFSELADQHPDAGVWQFKIGQVHSLAGDLKRAISAYERATKLCPDRLDYLTRLALTHLQNRDPDFALLSLDEAMRIDPNADSVHVLRGHAFRDLRRYDDATQCFERAMVIDAENAEAHYGFGRILLASKRFAEAITPARRAVELAPENGMYHQLLAHSLLESGDFSGAEEAARELARLSPDNPNAYKILAQSYAKRDRLGLASDAIRSLIRLDSRSSKHRVYLGDLALGAGDFIAAEDSFKEALTRKPGGKLLRQAKRGLANALFGLGRSEEGLDSLRDVIATSPDPDDLERLAFALLTDPKPTPERLAEIHSTIERLRIAKPDAPGTRILDALAVFRDGDPHTALQHWRSTKTPQRMRNYAGPLISVALSKEGQTDEAVAVLRRVINDLLKRRKHPSPIVSILLAEASKTLDVPVLGLGH